MQAHGHREVCARHTQHIAQGHSDISVWHARSGVRRVSHRHSVSVSHHQAGNGRQERGGQVDFAGLHQHVLEQLLVLVVRRRVRQAGLLASQAEHQIGSKKRRYKTAYIFYFMR